MRKAQKLALVAAILGSINWGLKGLFDFNLIEYIVGNDWITGVIYFLIGVSGISLIITWRQIFGSARKK